ncbi:MAG: alpha/beta fold hydrolase [Candidatus Kariarchaeaceae archaeon]
MKGPKNGPPLLLLHGLTTSWQAFLNLMPNLSLRWEVFSFDFRGHGKSDHVDSYYLRDYVEDTVSFINNIIASKESVTIFGHSLGSMVANMIAAESPNLVRGIINGDASLDKQYIIDTFQTIPPIWENSERISGLDVSREEIHRHLRDSTFINRDGNEVRLGNLMRPDVLLLLAVQLHHLDSKVISQWCRETEHALQEYVRDEYLPKIRCPMLILHADPKLSDRPLAIFEADIDAAHDHISIFEVIQLKGLSHMLQYDSIDAVLRAITGFLEMIR